jgi:hypothetical protein
VEDTVTRRRLPNRRPNETFTFEVADLHYTCTVGRFDDGAVGEIFLNNHKSNSAADTNARDSAIVASIALQCGADLETIRKALGRWARRSIRLWVTHDPPSYRTEPADLPAAD